MINNDIWLFISGNLSFSHLPVDGILFWRAADLSFIFSFKFLHFRSKFNELEPIQFCLQFKSLEVDLTSKKKRGVVEMWSGSGIRGSVGQRWKDVAAPVVGAQGILQTCSLHFHLIKLCQTDSALVGWRSVFPVHRCSEFSPFLIQFLYCWFLLDTFKNDGKCKRAETFSVHQEAAERLWVTGWRGKRLLPLGHCAALGFSTLKRPGTARRSSGEPGSKAKAGKHFTQCWTVCGWH